MKLSAAVITYNEEKNIGRFLDHVNDFVDEIIVVDSFSEDRTKEICLNYPKVKFIENHFEGYGPQKNFTLQHISGEWILFLDADEILDADAQKSVLKIVAEPKPTTFVYDIQFNNILLGKILRFGGWGRVKRERFFKKGHGGFTEEKVHENFVTNEKIELLEGKINHYTYYNIFHHIEKSNKYTSMMSEKMFENGRRSGVFQIFFKPKFQFLKSYILQMGILDGWAGYYAAKTAAFYTFLKYCKLYERQRSGEKQ